MVFPKGSAKVVSVSVCVLVVFFTNQAAGKEKAAFISIGTHFITSIVGVTHPVISFNRQPCSTNCIDAARRHCRAGERVFIISSQFCSGIRILDIKLDKPFRNGHIKRSGYFIIGHHIVECTCKPIGTFCVVIVIINKKAWFGRSAAGYLTVASEGEIQGPHQTFIAIGKADGAFRIPVHLHGSPGGTVVTHLQVLGRLHAFEEDKDYIARLPAGLDGLGGRGVAGVVGRKFKNNLRLSLGLRFGGITLFLAGHQGGKGRECKRKNLFHIHFCFDWFSCCKDETKSADVYVTCAKLCVICAKSAPRAPLLCTDCR